MCGCFLFLFSNDVLVRACPFNWLPWKGVKRSTQQQHMQDIKIKRQKLYWKKKGLCTNALKFMCYSIFIFYDFPTPKFLHLASLPSHFIFSLALYWIWTYKVYLIFAFLSLFKSTGLENGSGVGSDTISPQARLHCHSSDIYHFTHK